MRSRALPALLVALLVLAGCPRPTPGPAPLTPTAVRVACDAAVAACVADPRDELCAPAEACVRVRQAAELCLIDLGQCRSLAAIDVGEQAALRWEAERRVEALEGERWVWGAVGVALGAVVVGLAVGLGR